LAGLNRQRPPEARAVLPKAVNRLYSVSRRPLVALANLKSITFGTGSSSCKSTRMFEGFKSRWLIAFWSGCWTVEQTWPNTASRAGSSRRCRWHYSVIRCSSSLVFVFMSVFVSVREPLTESSMRLVLEEFAPAVKLAE
jgi:hypothetical protein